MAQVVVVGGGGHAKVVLEVLQAGGWTVVGFTDPARSVGDRLGPIPCLGDDTVLPHVRAAGVTHIIIAIGENALRWRLAQRAVALGFALANAVHPSAQISPSAMLGRGIAIMPGAVINAATMIGDNTIINTGATVDHDGRIGAGCHIAPGCHLGGTVTVGDGTLLGVGCAVIPGMTIGAWSVVGAGSVVVRDLPGACLALGIPARVIRHLAGPVTALS